VSLTSNNRIPAKHQKGKKRTRLTPARKNKEEEREVECTIDFGNGRRKEEEVSALSKLATSRHSENRINTILVSYK